MLPENPPHRIQLHPEIERAVGPMPIGSRGTWAPAPKNPDSINLTMVTKGYPIETERFLSDFRPTPESGTGSKLKSFIMKN